MSIKHRLNLLYQVQFLLIGLSSLCLSQQVLHLVVAGTGSIFDSVECRGKTSKTVCQGR